MSFVFEDFTDVNMDGVWDVTEMKTLGPNHQTNGPIKIINLEGFNKSHQ